jgi:hypothetical protein
LLSEPGSYIDLLILVLANENWISKRVLTSYTDILDYCCEARNKLTNQFWTTMPIGLREWLNTYEAAPVGISAPNSATQVRAMVVPSPRLLSGTCRKGRRSCGIAAKLREVVHKRSHREWAVYKEKYLGNFQPLLAGKAHYCSKWFRVVLSNADLFEEIANRGCYGPRCSLRPVAA